MKVKRNSKKVNVKSVSLKRLFEMFEGGEESNLEGLDEFGDAEDDGAEDTAEDAGEDFDEDFGEEEGGETVSVEIDPSAPLADVLRTIADALDGGSDEGDADEDFGDDYDEDPADDEPADETEGFEEEPSEDEEDDTEDEEFTDEDEESPATVTNGAPKKTVSTPEWQGKNKKTVNSKLNPTAQMFQI